MGRSPAVRRRRPAGRSRKATPALPSARALAQSLRVVLAHFSERGVSVDARRAALQEALARCDEPLQRHEASALHSVRARVDLLATWYRHGRYVGSDGQPLPLPLHGSPSLEELFGRFLPTSDPAGLVAQLESESVIRRASPTTWLPERRTLLMPTHSAGAIERVPYQIGAFLSTLAHNGAATKAIQRRLERTVVVDRFPARLLPEFDQYSKRLGGQLIDDLDNWLLRREAAADPSEPTLSVGVEVFAYVEPADRQSAVRPPTARRKKPS